MSEKKPEKIDKNMGENFRKNDENLRKNLPKKLKKAIVIAHPHFSPIFIKSQCGWSCMEACLKYRGK